MKTSLIVLLALSLIMAGCIHSKNSEKENTGSLQNNPSVTEKAQVTSTPENTEKKETQKVVGFEEKLSDNSLYVKAVSTADPAVCAFIQDKPLKEMCLKESKK